MAVQNLKVRQVAIDLQELKGTKPSIRDVRDHLKRCGHLGNDPDAVEQWEIERTRDWIKKARKYESNREGFKAELISLFEYAKDGTKVEYFRFVEECSVDEAVQHLQYWNRQGRIADKRFYHYLAAFSVAHGRHQLQERLKFEPPRDPDHEEAECTAG